MKKLFNVLVLTLAMNFLAIAGAIGWLYQTGRLDRSKIDAIKAIVFPPPAVAGPTTQPTQNPTTRPLVKLEELLAQHAGRPAAEQLDYIRQAFESQLTQLDRAHRGLLDLQKQVELAKKQLAADRLALEQQRKQLEERQQEAQRLAADQGFQDSLTLYESMPAKQVKALFVNMDDQTVVQYLQAMDERAAAKITREFKTPQELERLKQILDKLRSSQASAVAPTTPAP